MADRALKADAAKIVEHLLERESIQEGTVIIYNGGEEPQVIGDTGKKASAGHQVTVNGKRWHFEVTRNEEGQIVSLDVEQL